MPDLGKTSTARFMAIWSLATVPFAVLSSIGQVVCYGLTRELGVWISMTVVYAVLLLLSAVAGLVQSWILARQRAPVPAWTAAAVLGGLAGLLLGTMGSAQVASLARNSASMSSAVWWWFYQVMWLSTVGICFAVAQALALWGRRWTSYTLLWLAGILLLRVVPPLLLQMLSIQAGGRVLYDLGVTVMHGTIIAAGTAWLLDRLHFRPSAAA